jgi:hypothetical protein
MLESDYQRELKKRIIRRFGEDRTRVVKNDPNLPGQQGIPDLTVYIGPKWFLLEVKASEKSKMRPNQEYWIDFWSNITFCSFIYPENEEEVLNAMERSLEA